ncbi:MAG: ATP-dependent RecD-like DNA helicase [Oscillospiraceae bacterium]|nr:ATP-dependent RecD-like DNA helicase [Oscillospiraceae bacterium]
MDTKITGTVEDVAYSSAERGFAVIDMDVNGELVTVVGELYPVCAGEELTVWGEFTSHPTFGYQFKASACERVLPSSAGAICKYLSNGAIAGVGPALARRIVDAFSDRTLDVIANEPMKLTNIRGISAAKAKKIGEEFRKIYGVRETFAQLSSLGLDMADSLALYRAYGDVTVEIVRDNPYMICGYPVFKEFSAADELAGKLGFEGGHVNRMTAGIVYILRHNLGNGHTCLPAEALIDRAASFLDVDRDAVEIRLYDAAAEGRLCIERFGGTEMVFLPDMRRAEKYIAERLLLLKGLEYRAPADADARIDAFEKAHTITYEALQRKAIRGALSHGAVVITGGPGTGKTTALDAILCLCEQNGDEVALCAPTGRAAKRLAELTGREAKTIHRLLEVEPMKGDALRFVHDDQNPLKCDVVVVDEMSMTDVLLFESLLRGLRPQCRLVMVGDADQLPSVGAGNVLRDIVESGVCETVEFTKIFRQAAQSLIVVNAHSIVEGEMPDIDTKDRDFFFLRAAKEEAAKLVCDLAARRLPKSYGYDPLADIAVLTPSRIGTCGTAALNEGLRARLNPKAQGKNELRVMGMLLREGDRVMQIKNNYDIEWSRDGGERGLGVFNGDIGVVERIDQRQRQLRVRFDDRAVDYTFEQAGQLEPAYAVTVHKSQGSEFRCVILALSDFSRKLCYRNLLYTAVTRARENLIIVGEQAVLEAMVANDRRMLRYTGLRAFLRGEIT